MSSTQEHVAVSAVNTNVKTNIWPGFFLLLVFFSSNVKDRGRPQAGGAWGVEGVTATAHTWFPTITLPFMELKQEFVVKTAVGQL